MYSSKIMVKNDLIYGSIQNSLRPDLQSYYMVQRSNKELYLTSDNLSHENKSITASLIVCDNNHYD